MVHPIDPPPPTCVDPERGQGVRTPLKNHKNRGFPSNTGPDPLKFSKLPSQHTSELSMLGQQRHTSKTPFKWPAFSGIRILSLLKNKNNNVSWTPILAKFSRSVHAPCYGDSCQYNRVQSIHLELVNCKPMNFDLVLTIDHCNEIMFKAVH